MIDLQNKRILVTREEQAAKQFSKKIAAAGGNALLAPLLQINCLSDTNQTGASILKSKYDWVFFTSKNGVDCFMKQAESKEILSSARIATVGPKTAQAVERYPFSVDFIPSTYNAEVMAAEFLRTYSEEGSVLFVRGKIASTILLDAFTKAGRTFDCLEVYDTVTNEAIKPVLQTILQEKSIDYLTFTSPSTVNAFVQLVDEFHLYKHIPVVCIGTTTEKQARNHGFLQTIIPEHFTTEGMIEVMHQVINEKG